MSFASLLAHTTRLLSTGPNFTQFMPPADILEAVKSGIREHSYLHPWNRAITVTSDGNKRQAVPTWYDEGFSSIVSIETPIDSVPPDFLLRNSDFMIVKADEDVSQIGFMVIPKVGDSMRITATRMHRISDSVTRNIASVAIDGLLARVTLAVADEDMETGDIVTLSATTTTPVINGARVITVISSTVFTVPITITAGSAAAGTVTFAAYETVDRATREAIGFLGAHEASKVLAQRFAHSAEPIILQDSVNYQSKRYEFEKQAKIWLETYEKMTNFEALCFVTAQGKSGLPLDSRMDANRFTRWVNQTAQGSK